jgi:hypothetical protein
LPSRVGTLTPVRIIALLGGEVDVSDRLFFETACA